MIRVVYQYRVGEIINKDELRPSLADYYKSQFGAGMAGQSEIKQPTFTSPATVEYPGYTPVDYSGIYGESEVPEASYLDMPAYEAPASAIPEYTPSSGVSESQIKKLTRQTAAPGLRNLRQQMMSISGQHYANPNVKKMTLRQALAGYGAGLESVMSGARTTAGKEALAEAQLEESSRRAAHSAAVEKQRLQNEQSYKEYVTQAQKVAEENRRIAREREIALQLEQEKRAREATELERTSMMEYGTEMRQAEAEESRRKEEAERKYQKELMEYYSQQKEKTSQKKEVTPIRYAGASAPKSKPPDFSQYVQQTKPKSTTQPTSFDLSTLLSTGGGGYEPAPLISDEEWESYYKS